MKNDLSGNIVASVPYFLEPWMTVVTVVIMGSIIWGWGW